jgi:predicted nucleotidyltransferase
VATDAGQYLGQIGQLLKAFKTIGVDPVLVGGMALVMLGSRRVTRDFDFLVAWSVELMEHMLKIFYQQGFQLAAKVDPEGEITHTLSNRRVAMARIRIDEPSSLYFLHGKSGLRVDLLLDFPVDTEAILARAQKMKVEGHLFYVASTEDLLALKRKAFADRQLSTDRDDIEFLQRALAEE